MPHSWPQATVEIVEYDPDHPRPNVFLQWKGTDACFDFYCECGEHSHFDGYFAHQFECCYCGTRYVMPATIYVAKVAKDSDLFPHTAVITE